MIITSRPLSGWVIVLDGARNFIGMPKLAVGPTGTIVLSPVYELRTIVDPRVGIMRQIVPVLMYPVESLTVRCYTRINLNDLPLAEVENLQKALSTCEEAMVHLRAHQTGIATATPAETAKIVGLPSKEQ